MITEDDWIKPLVLVRNIAADAGVSLTEQDEQSMCRQITEAVTVAMFDEIAARRDQALPSADPEPFIVRDFL